MNKTAVEWYDISIGILMWKFFNNEISTIQLKHDLPEIFNQAKEMEMQKFEKIYNDAWMLGQDHIEKDFKDYYNETFKNK